jgi:hypothetical protein
LNIDKFDFPSRLQAVKAKYGTADASSKDRLVGLVDTIPVSDMQIYST